MHSFGLCSASNREFADLLVSLFVALNSDFASKCIDYLFSTSLLNHYRFPYSAG